MGEQRLVRQARGGHEYAHVKLSIEPLARGKGYEFSEQVTVRDSLPRKSLSYIEIGVLKAAERGLWGFPLTDFRVCILDGSYHEADSTAAAFEEVAKRAFVEAMHASHPVILEPWVSLIVCVPEEYVGMVMGDLNERRGLIDAIRHALNQEIEALLPQSEVADYLTNLASITGGSGICSLRPYEFKELPDSLSLHCYCVACRRDMLIPLIRSQPFTDKCLICRNPFEPPEALLKR